MCGGYRSASNRSGPAARFARVGETSEVAGRNAPAAPLVIQARAEVAAADSWTRRALQHRARLLPPHQAAGDRAAARHHAAGHDPGRRRDAVARADPRGALRWRARRRRRQHHQLLDRARPRPDDAPHRAPAAPPRRRQARGRAGVRPGARSAGLRAALVDGEPAVGRRSRSAPCCSTCSCTRSGSSPGARRTS